MREADDHKQGNRETVRYSAQSKIHHWVRYDLIVSFDPYEDGGGIMRDTQIAKPQPFQTGDHWFAYNLAGNPAQM